MNSPAAFRATYSDLKLIKTRQCVQIVFELPLADFDAAYTILGGMPNPASETWFAIAPLKTGKEAMPNLQRAPKPDARPLPDTDRPPTGAKRDWRELQPAQQAGIRCGEAIFHAFLNETREYRARTPTEAAEAVREICGVQSRVELGTNHKARTIWHQLDSEFEAWKMKEHVGA